MRERVLQMVKMVMEDPAVESLNAFVGGGGSAADGAECRAACSSR